MPRTRLSMLISAALALLLMPSIATADGWTPLTLKDAQSKGACKALQESSPVKEYYKVSRCSDNGAKFKWNSCTPTGFYKKFDGECGRSPLKCKFVAKVLGGKAQADYRKLFQGLLLMHDPAVVKAMVSSPRYNHYFAGSCMDKSRYPFHEAMIGLGAIGNKADIKYLNGIVDTEAKVKELGRDLRNRVATAFWWLGDRAGEKGLMSLMALAHMKRYPGREFRTIALMALSEWKSDAAVELCGDNLRDIKSNDLTACMVYLARRGKKKFGKQMVRYIEQARGAGIFALGMTKHPDGKKWLKAQLKKHKQVNSAYLHEYVAALLAGIGGAWGMIPKVLKKYNRPSPVTLNNLAWLAGTKYAKKAIAQLKKFEKKWKKDHASSHARSVAVRALLGDKRAIKQVIKLLGSNEADVRKTVVDCIGARWGNLSEHTPGLGVVANKKLLPALAEAHNNEAKERLRTEMAKAGLNIRAALRARGK